MEERLTWAIIWYSKSTEGPLKWAAGEWSSGLFYPLQCSSDNGTKKGKKEKRVLPIGRHCSRSVRFYVVNWLTLAKGKESTRSSEYIKRLLTLFFVFFKKKRKMYLSERSTASAAFGLLSTVWRPISVCWFVYSLSTQWMNEWMYQVVTEWHWKKKPIAGPSNHSIVCARHSCNNKSIFLFYANFHQHFVVIFFSTFLCHCEIKPFRSRTTVWWPPTKTGTAQRKTKTKMPNCFIVVVLFFCLRAKKVTGDWELSKKQNNKTNRGWRAFKCVQLQLQWNIIGQVKKKRRNALRMRQA